MKTTIAIINYDTPQFIYYLVQSIKKQCNEDYSLCIFDNGRERRIVNKLDNITIYRNNKNRYFKVDNLSIDEVYDKSIRTLCNILTDDRLIIINPCTLVNNTFLNVYKNSDLFFETFDKKCVSIRLNSIDKSLLDDYNKPIIDVLKDHYPENQPRYLMGVGSLDYILEGSRFNIVENKVVLVVPKNNVKNIKEDLLIIGLI